MILRDLQGLTYNEMAKELALPEGTVKSRINRGREELARALAARAAAGPAAPWSYEGRPAEGGVMQLVFDARGDVTLVRVQEAKLTYPLLSSFFSEVQQRVEGGARKIVIDLGAVSYLDSASIGCRMDIHRLLQEKGGALRLSGLQSRVETMISMTGVHKIVPLHRDEEEALASFGATGGETQ